MPGCFTYCFLDWNHTCWSCSSRSRQVTTTAPTSSLADLILASLYSNAMSSNQLLIFPCSCTNACRRCKASFDASCSRYETDSVHIRTNTFSHQQSLIGVSWCTSSTSHDQCAIHWIQSISWSNAVPVPMISAHSQDPIYTMMECCASSYDQCAFTGSDIYHDRMLCSWSLSSCPYSQKSACPIYELDQNQMLLFQNP